MQDAGSQIVLDSPRIQPARMRTFLHLAIMALVESVRALYSFLLPGLHKETDLSWTLSFI